VVFGLVTVLGIWAAAGALLAWGLLPSRWRAALSITLSLAGIVFLVLATGTEGFRETQSTTAFLAGPPQVTALASASASLPYYVLTAVCLLLGSLGLATSKSVARLLARRFVLWATIVSLLVIAMRFLLEKAAAPAAWSSAFGVVWLPPVVGAWFYYRLRQEGRGVRDLALSLFAYGLLVRAPVLLVYVLATRLHFGSHFDLSSVRRIEDPFGNVYSFEPGSAEQLFRLAVVPQLFVWPFFTVVSGLIGATMLWVLWRAARGGEPAGA
jgi:hypothetical protein